MPICPRHGCPQAGGYSISDLAELFAVSRPTVYRTLDRVPARSDDNYREQNAAI